MEQILTEQQIALIRKITLFRGMSDELRHLLLDQMDYELVDLKKGEVIIHQGTLCQHMYILLKGSLDVNIIDVSGNKVKVEDIIAPRSFASPHLFNDNNIFPATFTAAEDGLLLRATKESVFKLISTEPQVLKNFLHQTGNCNECTVGRLRILSYKGIRSRFAVYIFDKRRKDCDLVIMQHNQTQLAEYIGVTRPALASEMKKMSDEGLIRIEGRKVTILNLTTLMQYL